MCKQLSQTQLIKIKVTNILLIHFLCTNIFNFLFCNKILAKKEPVQTQWKNGYWYNKDTVTFYIKVDGEKAEMRNIIDFDFPELKPMSTGEWKFGDFGPAKTEVAEMCGIKNYNVQIPSFFGMMSAVLNKEGNKLYFFGFTKKVRVTSLEHLSLAEFSCE